MKAVAVAAFTRPATLGAAGWLRPGLGGAGLRFNVALAGAPDGRREWRRRRSGPGTTFWKLEGALGLPAPRLRQALDASAAAPRLGLLEHC